MRGLASLVGGEKRQWNDSSYPWFAPVGAGGTRVTERSALALSAVWACETLIADAIATLPVDVYRKQSDGSRVEVAKPAWVDYPNPEMNRVDYDTARIMSLLGWGNAYSLLIREQNSTDPLAPIVARYILDPTKVQVSDEHGMVAYKVNGQSVPAAWVQHVRGHILPGCVTGMSVVQQAARTLQLAHGAEQAGQKFYEQGMMLSGAIEIPQMPAETSVEVVDRLRDQMAERYAGSGNAGKPLVLLGGSKWSQMTVNPSDAQYLQTREFQVEEICRWFRVPLHKVQRITGNASQGGGNGLEQMALEFITDGLTPWTVRLEWADTALLRGKQYLKYNTSAYVRSDLKTRTEVLAIRRQNGVINADQWLAIEDEEPIGGQAGSAYWMPLNMGDAAQAGAPASDPSNPGVS